ncbi:hypothetical protein Angca_006061, partial [Angiostrongylus cantonensis]
RRMSKENRTRKKTIISLGSSVVKKEDWVVVLQDIGIRIKPFSSRTKYLVASSVQDALYRAEICRLQIFAGLTISFIGISDQKIEEYTRSVMDNAGRVSPSTMNATHIIIASGQPPPASCYGKNLVTMEWFNESMDLGWCANEQCFKYRRVEPSRLQPSTSFLIFQRRRRVENSAMKYKRYQLCLELLKTEINCLKTSDFLVKLFEENAHVSAEANDIMFGVFGGMCQAHDGIVRRMGEVLDTWNDHSTIGDIFVERASSLKDAYSPYFHTLETSLQYIKEYRKQNAKFNSFIMEKERDRSVGKQKLEYLLNVPFQQITSRIPVSLKEIRSQTTTLDPDFERLGEAIAAIDRMLRVINENKKICAETEAIFKKIQGLPGFLLKAPRQFICGMEFLSMPNETNAWICSIVELLLFKDCVLMIEKLDPSVSCSEILRFKKSIKASKFIEYCHLIRIRAVRIVKSSNEENILVIVVRNYSKDAEWYLKILQSVDSTNEFVKKLVGEVFQATGRRISIDEGCLSELDEATLNESRFSSATSKVLRWVSLRRSRFMNRSITTAAAAFERNDVDKAPIS